MNPPVVLSVRIKGDANGPQTGDVVLDNSTIQSWAPGKEYETGDVFVYDGQFYQATEDFVAGETFNTDHCEQVGIPDLVLSSFTPDTYYSQGEMITENGQLFIANEDFTSGDTFNKNDWTQIGGGSYNFTSSDGTVQISIQDGGETVSFSVANTVNNAVRELQTKIDAKQDAIEGKTLSTNDFTDNAKQKLDNLVNITQIGENLVLSQTGKLDALIPETRYDDYLDAESTNAVQNRVITDRVQQIQSAVQQIETDLSNVEGDTDRLEESIGNLQTRTAAVETNVGTLETNITALQNSKVDKVAGKGLSSNDYTTEEKQKLDSLETITSVGTGLNLDANGKLTADIPEVNLYDTTGQHTDGAMTQKATTDALTLKADKNSLAIVATSGSYNDLADKPIIPTRTSELLNDSNFVADANYVHTDFNFSQDYINIINDYNSKELTAAYNASTKTVTLDWTAKQQ